MPERTTQFQQLRGQSKQLLQSSIQWADTCQRFETQCQRPNYNMIPNCMCLCQWLHKVGALLVLQNKDTQGLRTFRLFLKGIFPQLRNHIKKMLQELIVNRLSNMSYIIILSVECYLTTVVTQHEYKKHCQCHYW